MMKRVLFGFAVVVLLIGTGNGWEIIYNEIDYGISTSAAACMDSGYIVCGSMNSDFSLIKINESGITDWMIIDDCAGFNDMLVDIARIDDTTFITVGHYRIFVSGYDSYYYDSYIRKFNSSGEILWQRRYNFSHWFFSDMILSITPFNNSNFFITGWYNYYPEYAIGFVALMDSAGNIYDSYEYFDGGWSEIKEVSIVVPESLYAVVGYRSWDDSSFIAFLNDSLDSLYIKTFDYQINSIAVLSSNIIYATGKNSDNELILLEILILPGSGGFELYELCYSYPLKGCSVGNKIIITDDGDIAVVGNTSISPGEQTDIFLLKIGRYGVIWQRYFGGSGFEYGKDVINTMDGGFLVTGSSNNKAYIVKTDSLGFSGVERFELHNGWNLLSSPLSDTFAVLDAFPYAIPPAWGFDIAEGGYYCIDSVRAGTGFWLFSPIDTIAALCGTSEVSTVIDTLFPGWNLIGGPATDVPVGSLTDYEEVLSPIYSFDPESDEYIVAEYIRPGYGYWVLASDTVEIVMP